MRFVLEKTGAEGAVFVSLEVRISNMPARALYKKLGFELIGLRKDYYINPAEDALVLGLNI
jgi:ribosomal-protein-alanine N-acetyltransferase